MFEDVRQCGHLIINIYLLYNLIKSDSYKIEFWNNWKSLRRLNTNAHYIQWSVALPPYLVRFLSALIISLLWLLLVYTCISFVMNWRRADRPEWSTNTFIGVRRLWRLNYLRLVFWRIFLSTVRKEFTWYSVKCHRGSKQTYWYRIVNLCYDF